MEAAGYIEIIWKKGKEGHIVQSVALNLKALPRIYSYLGRASKQQLLEEMIRLLKNLRQQYPTPVALRFVDFLLERLQAGKTVKEYISLSRPEEAERLVRAVSLMESNRKDCYLREFSIAHFSDSKAVEEMRPGLPGYSGSLNRALRILRHRTFLPSTPSITLQILCTSKARAPCGREGEALWICGK